ncbi:MAG: undecaprenyldiphospho-muramoylpentapeptide beta-N-acetylglucosaminyltransferase, partial [Alphaproteobacteria bacterium]|nr:undecaprenyldiphospho-muramoylpentapeptide beta-N-acetylglucosaminyltransferase [Alphaproteobacteria bacterium]
MRTAPIILLAAGGTAGHMYPASALARQLKTEGYTPHLATDKRGLQYIQKLESMVVHKLPAATIFGKGIMAVPLKLITLGASFVASIYLLVRLRPQAVVGFGGYPSFAPAMVGLLLGKRVLIHEQNAVLGRANRVLAMLGAKLATSFRQTKHIPPQTRRRFTGNPIRQDIEMAALAPYPDPSTTPFQILIFGGSQGAQVLSQIIPQALCALPQDLRIRIRIVHQVAEQDMQETQNEYKAGSIDANIKTYFDDMPMQMRAAHLVICRGGASTIAELTALGVPAIIVPLQNSLDQDQSYNAQALARSGAQIIPQNELSPDSIATSIEGFMRNPERLHDAAAGAKSLGVTDGASRLGDYLHQLVQHKTERPLYHDAVQSFCGDGAVHIIGIGGIGMSGIAEILVNAGCVVQGSDIASNANTARLEKLGVTIFIGHSGAHIVKNKVSMVTHSPAIQADNPELVAAQDAQINIANRA